MKFTIRPATPSDIPAITSIYAHAVAHGTASFELHPPDEAEMTRRMANLTGKGYPFLAAELDGKLAGYAYASPFACGRPIAGRSRIRSTSRPNTIAAASVAPCSPP